MPLCIICKTLEGDVKQGLEAASRCSKETLATLKESKTVIIMQVGMRKYDNLKKADRESVIKEIEKKHITHILTIHRKDCLHAGKNTITGYIVNDCVTGLRRCKHCLS